MEYYSAAEKKTINISVSFQVVICSMKTDRPKATEHMCDNILEN